MGRKTINNKKRNSMINTKKLNLKVGDTVYWAGLEGKVTKASSLEHDLYPYIVQFKEVNGDLIRNWFTLDGYGDSRLKETQLPISLTPYKVKTKGYTNTPPLTELDKDKVVYVRDGYTHNWSMRFPSHFNKRGVLECFVSQKKEGCTIPWKQYSFTNPLEK